MDIARISEVRAMQEDAVKQVRRFDARPAVAGVVMVLVIWMAYRR